VRYGRLSRRRGRRVARAIAAARALRLRLDETLGQGASAADADPALMGEISRYSMSTVCDKRELFWPRHLFNFRLGGVLSILARYCMAGPRRIR
ncbi:MAG TPA: hypothetical protein VMB48_11360, partial [Steroidobacteraceae bacterium]|nr:hypothetical protein [Steroidobacteraceae bacterium]